MQRQTQRIAGFGDLLRHLDIGGGRGWVTRRMIMNKDKRRSVQFQRAFGDLARIHRDMINRSLALFLVRDQDILAVQIKNAKLFSLAMCHGRCSD